MNSLMTCWKGEGRGGEVGSDWPAKCEAPTNHVVCSMSNVSSSHSANYLVSGSFPASAARGLCLSGAAWERSERGLGALRTFNQTIFQSN